MIRAVALAGLALVVALAPAPAVALSCIRPDIARDYQAADESSDVYIAVLGQLTFDESKLPVADFNRMDTPPRHDITARLTGRSLSDTGFDRPFDREITLRILCFGPWCGHATQSIPVLSFLRREGQDYVLDRSPCGGMSYDNPTAEQMQIVETCFAGGPCEPAEPM